MEAQSNSIGFSFGINYELGKRTIRAMSNEEFNALTPATLADLHHEHNLGVVSQLQSELPQFTAMMHDIINQQVEIEIAKAERTPSAMAEIITALLQGTNAQIEDTINSFTGNATSTEVAIQTLSLISPFMALLGLIGSQGGSSGGGGTPTATTIKTFTLSQFTSSENITMYTVIWSGNTQEFNHSTDPIDIANSLTTLNNEMIALGDKWPNEPNLFNREVEEFNGGIQSTNLGFASDAVKFVHALQKWEILNAL